jgi:hypothetical protein
MRGVLRSESTVTDKYEFIESQKITEKKYAYPVAFMCAHLAVSQSGFYEWRSRPESATAERREYLKTLVRKAFDDSAETYGYRRVHAQLTRWGSGRTGTGQSPDARAGPGGLSATAPAHPDPGRSHGRTDPRPRGMRVHRRRTRRDDGRRYHVYLLRSGMMRGHQFDRRRIGWDNVVSRCPSTHRTLS